MFRKTRRRIVLSVMAAMFFLLAVNLLAIYGFSYLSIRKQSREMLSRYVSVYSLDHLPGSGWPEAPPGKEVPRSSGGDVYQLSSFYSVSRADDGSVLAVDTGKNGLYEKDEIISLTDQIAARKDKEGKFSHLLYQVEERDGYTLVACIDMTLTENNNRILLLQTLIAGLVSMGIICLLSILLSDRIIRPLEENDRKQKQFISDAGHELKTPVSVISANTELLARQSGENQWLSNIRYENQRMGELVSELLELSRAENTELSQEILDFSRLVEQEVLPFESMAFEHGLSIFTHITDQVMVRGNQNQLSQLISILIDNAISYSLGGNIIEVTLKKDNREAVLLVENPGEKIPEDEKEKLFDRFYRADEARTGDQGHFGLGLSIARAITDVHKGRIKADWIDGKVIISAIFPLEK